jgi:hypothetical protein
MNELDLLADCLKRLNSLPVDYYVTGSMASNFWGIPRTTHDLDFVIRIEDSAIRPLIAAFSGDFYIDESAIKAAFAPPYQFSAIDTRSALKVDFWLPTESAFDQEMLHRRIRESVNGIPAWIATAEDIILHKLVWNRITPSDRQMKDVAGIWAVQRGALDLDYLRRWADELQLTGDLERILKGEVRPKTT